LYGLVSGNAAVVVETDDAIEDADAVAVDED
jgi:hypothetical protein